MNFKSGQGRPDNITPDNLSQYYINTSTTPVEIHVPIALIRGAYKKLNDTVLSTLYNSNIEDFKFGQGVPTNITPDSLLQYYIDESSSEKNLYIPTALQKGSYSKLSDQVLDILYKGLFPPTIQRYDTHIALINEHINWTDASNDFKTTGTVEMGNLTIGFGVADVDYFLKFDGETNDGIITWMEDEDYFRFGDDIGLDNFEELRFYDDGGNYVGFKAPALTADQIWTLPDADGGVSQVLKTDGAGNLGWDSNASEKSWSFTSPAGSSGSFFYGGFYDRATSANDFNPSITFGTANSSYAAHFFLVQAAGSSGGTDTVIRITGTTINDQGIRATGQTVDLTIDNAGAAGTYYETSEKWIGRISIVKISGPDLLCNYGFSKYWDNNNTDFKITGIEAVWLAGANDSGIDIQVIHHKTTGWTYNAGAVPDFPALITLQGDHVTEHEAVNGENGAWKRANLSTVVNGANGEGVIFCVITTANKAFELGNLMVRIVPQ